MMNIQPIILMWRRSRPRGRNQRTRRPLFSSCSPARCPSVSVFILLILLLDVGIVVVDAFVVVVVVDDVDDDDDNNDNDDNDV